MKRALIYYEILAYQPENLDLLNNNFDVTTVPDPSHDKEFQLEQAEIILAPLGYYVGKEKIDQMPHLKCIGSNTTGHPHIDVEYAAKKGIKVVTLKDHQDFLDTITPTSELTWGLIIALSRKMLPAARSVTNGNWSRWPFGGEHMLSQMRLGIIGLGRLGKKVAGYGRAFDMEVAYYDPYVDAEKVGFASRDLELISRLEDLVSWADIITLHVPHEPETENLINRTIIGQFKPGSFFINTSRGELVDHDALLHALKGKAIGGAALDVLDGEFVPGFENRVLENALVQYARNNDNLIITPHIGGSTRDAWTLTQEFTIKKIIEYFENI